MPDTYVMPENTPTDDRLVQLEVARALHERQLQDHEVVLKELRDHLSKLVDRLASVEKKLVILGCIAIGGDKALPLLQAAGILPQ